MKKLFVIILSLCFFMTGCAELHSQTDNTNMSMEQFISDIPFDRNMEHMPSFRDLMNLCQEYEGTIPIESILKALGNPHRRGDSGLPSFVWKIDNSDVEVCFTLYSGRSTEDTQQINWYSNFTGFRFVTEKSSSIYSSKYLSKEKALTIVEKCKTGDMDFDDVISELGWTFVVWNPTTTTIFTFRYPVFYVDSSANEFFYGYLMVECEIQASLDDFNLTKENIQKQAIVRSSSLVEQP